MAWQGHDLVRAWPVEGHGPWEGVAPEEGVAPWEDAVHRSQHCC